MAEEKSKQVEALYDLAVKSVGSPQPKHIFLSWKCPKCDSKLNKKSVKETIVVGGGIEFASKVGKDAKLSEGVYSLSIDHFTCKCTYGFAKARVDVFGDRTG